MRYMLNEQYATCHKQGLKSQNVYLLDTKQLYILSKYIEGWNNIKYIFGNRLQGSVI